MSGKHYKSARRKARRYESMMDRNARRKAKPPWYVLRRKRWWRRWEGEHQRALKETTKRMAHALVEGKLRQSRLYR